VTRHATGWLALAGAAALAFSGCARRPAAESVVIVTVDTWRADAFGAGGHPSVRTPHLDRFFRGGLQFADASSPVPTTLASHASILSGEWPTGHRVPRNGWPVPDDVHTIAEILRERGFATGAFVSSAALHPSFGLDQGFQVYDFETPRVVERDQDWRGAEDTLRRAEAWWSGHAGERRLLWVHLFEPHFPYAPAPEDFALYDTGYRGPANGSMDFLFAMWEDASLLPPAARDHLESLYHAEITGMDRKAGAFLERLAVEPGVVSVIVGDHGESLGEHGLRFKHGPLVYPADVDVPLVIRGVPPFGPGVSGRLVRTVDLIGTLLDRLGVRADLPADAGDLVDGPFAEHVPPAFSEASMPWNVEQPGAYPNLFKQRAIRTKEWTYVETPYLRDYAWYRRATDPAERDPVAGPEGVVRERLPRELEDWIDRGRERPPPTGIDPDLLDRLESLGYIE